MMPLSKLFLTAALLLGWALGGQRGFAQAPTGSITNFISASSNSLWDASVMFPNLTSNTWGGSFMIFAARATNDALQISLTNDYRVNGSGKLSGRGTNDLTVSRFSLAGAIGTNQVPHYITNLGHVQVTFVSKVVTNWSWVDLQDLEPVEATYTTSGNVLGEKGNAIVTFKNVSTGQIQLHGVKRRMTTTKAYHIFIFADGSALRGSYGNLISVSGQPGYAAGGRFNNFNPFTYYLGGGAWTLVLTFDPPSATAPNNLSGTATATLSSEAVYPFKFTGRYVPAKNQSQLFLRGVVGDATTGDARGAALTVTLGSDGKILQMLGRIAGQAILQR